MAQQALVPNTLSTVMKTVPLVTSLPMRRLWFDYDQEADVLYITVERPQKATNSKLRDDGVLLRYRGKKLVGITVFDASSR